MSGANKILTVSYGTFSCTIEGFDDPFGTMKQIAEYFRDLAAEDRYFGAEPPVPDAEALRHIAEREAARRVEARLGSQGVHLRQLDGAAAADAAMPVAPVAQPAAPPPAAAATAAAPQGAATVLSPSEVIDPAPETVADRLSRIRAVVARARTAPVWPQDEDAEIAEVAPAPAPAAQTPAAAAPATATSAPAPQAAPVAVPVASAAAVASSVAAAELPVSADFAADPVPTTPANILESDAPLAEPAPEPMAGSDAAPLSDPEEDAVAFAAEFPAETDLTDSEAAPVQASDLELDAGDAWATGPEEAASPAMSAADEEAPAEATEPGDPVIAVGSADETADNPDWTAQAYAAVDLPMARVAALRKDDHAAAEATGQLDALLSGAISPEDLFVEAPAPLAAAPADEDDSNASVTESLLQAIRAASAPTDSLHADEDDTPAPTARRAFADDTDIEPTGPAPLAAAVEPLRLGPDDQVEADWRTVAAGDTADDMAEEVADDMAAIDADIDDGSPLILGEDSLDASWTGAAWAAADESTEDDRSQHDRAVDDLERFPEDASVDRLLAATNSQLDSTEVNRRRSAIAHLKAAVAAARAERTTAAEPLVEADPADESAMDKFREDLARVVRPRRPVDQGEARPSRRMPPLMLVSEQRIDLGEPRAVLHDAASGPVRPRRVSTRELGAEDEAAETNGFADFAEAMGARDLPDMLEAAAAYSAFVEGRPSFSRPQLMQMMRAAEGASDEFSREEQLRSFGLLLRQGRIHKLKRGQFTVADDTRFRPDRRHAGE
jgi:hypothetical protein